MTYASLEWQDQAACAGLDVNIFFPDRYHGPAARIANNICKRCDVRVQCAEYGRTQPAGIWGGAPSPYVQLDYWQKAQAKVDGIGARRRLAALARDGYSSDEVSELLAHATGIDKPWLYERIRYGTRRTVSLELHEAIAELYDRIDGVRSTSPDAGRIARNAAAKGWHDRAAWRGIDIDDPRTVAREYRR